MARSTISATRRGGGSAIWSRRWRPDGKPDPKARFRSLRGVDDLSRAGEPADRRQVRRPRPRPGRRRGGGPSGRRRICSTPRIAPSGAASSRRCKRPKSACWSSLRCRWRLILMLLYMAFHSLLDAVVVLSNVVGRLDGRHLGALADREQLQHLGRRRFHLDLRRGDHGRAAAGLRRSTNSERRARTCPRRFCSASLSWPGR